MNHSSIRRGDQAHLLFSGTVVPAVLLLLAALLLCVGQYINLHTVSVLGAWLILMAGLFYEVRSRIAFGMRSSASRARNPALALPQWVGSSVVVWTIACLAFSLGYKPSDLEPTRSAVVVTLSGPMLLLCLTITLSHYYSRLPTDELVESTTINCWLRLTAWVCVTCVAVTLLIAGRLISNERDFVRLMMFFCTLPGCEFVVRALYRDKGQPSLVDDLVIVRAVFHDANPLVSILHWLESAFGVDVRSTWALGFVRRSITPLLLSLAVVGWLSTSLVVVGASEAGLLLRLGTTVSSKAMPPGLHLKAPWPIDTVRYIAADRVRTMPLGYSGAREGASMLWTERHAEEEYSLLLGDGRDLVSINALLQYRIDSPWNWQFLNQNPETALRAVAERALLCNTVDCTLSQVLAENLSELSSRIRTDISQQAASIGLGVEIISLSLQGLHPPVRVAEDYQAVVSAQHERETVILDGIIYRTETTKRAQSKATEKKNNALAYEAIQLNMANAEAESFDLLEASHRLQPDLFRHRYQLDSLDKAMADRAILVIDDRIEQDGAQLWFAK